MRLCVVSCRVNVSTTQAQLKPTPLPRKKLHKHKRSRKMIFGSQYPIILITICVKDYLNIPNGICISRESVDSMSTRYALVESTIILLQFSRRVVDVFTRTKALL